MSKPILTVSDFIEEAHSQDMPVQSLLDIDFYKFTMGQLIEDRFPDVEVVFKLIVRDPRIPIAAVIPEAQLRKTLDYCMGLSFEGNHTDFWYLRGIDIYGKNMFSEEYLSFLRGMHLTRYQLHQVGDSYELTFVGPWKIVTYWETIALAVISQLYYRNLMARMTPLELQILYARAMDRLYTKLQKLLTHSGITFADFCQRRRHSFLWQQWVIGVCKEVMGSQFVGTSNTWMAFHHKLVPIGTNAHELPMVLAALANSDEELRYAQYRVPELWQETYTEGLRIFLPDTFGTAQFFRNAPAWLAEWRGMRQDSGNPITAANLYMRWLEQEGKDPRTKLEVFSDGLDVDPMIKLDDHFGTRLGHTFGIGTLLGNDFEGCFRGLQGHLFRPIPMVCKVVAARPNSDEPWRSCVKISDNPNKRTGPAEEVARYVSIFGEEGQEAFQVTT